MSENSTASKLSRYLNCLSHVNTKEDRSIQVTQDFPVSIQIYCMRKERGLTQREHAQRVSITTSVISNLGNHEPQSLNLLRAIAKALDCTLKISFQKNGD